ncbi:MAG: DUF4919 domain-containing protein [Ginsengibacter sp.]
MQPATVCLITIYLLLKSSFAFSQDTKIEIPKFKDKYSAYVKQLEDGKTDIDFTDFRNSFLDSEQFGKKGKNYDDLRKQVYEAIKSKDYKKVLELTKGMLSIDYTSMFAHKFLNQTYKVLGDTVNSAKYHDIEFGLINSIAKSGDGKTCETGWHVTQVEEEYFILNIMEADFQSQSLISSSKNSCDKMGVKTKEGEVKTYYFEINKVMEMERKILGL